MRKSDGSCDEMCNTEICGFDGGDCEFRLYNNHVVEIVFELNPDKFTKEEADSILSKLNSIFNSSCSFVLDKNGEIEAFRWTKSAGRKERIIFGNDEVSHEEDEFVQILIKVDQDERAVVEYLNSLDTEKSRNLFGIPIAEARLNSRDSVEVDDYIRKLLLASVFVFFVLAVVVGLGKRRKVIHTTAVHYPGSSAEEGSLFNNIII